MKVTVYFADGERVEGDSGAMTLTKIGFPVLPNSGNSDLIWVSLSAIKYVLIHAGNLEPSEEGDPREKRGLPKVVIRFQDGEVVRTYRDDNWSQEGEGFKLRIWDPQTRVLTPALLSMHHVKGIFMVKEWDSRTPGEKLIQPGRRPLNLADGGSPEPVTAAATATPPPANGGRGNDEIQRLAQIYRGQLARIRDHRLSARAPEEFVAGVRHHLAQLLAQDNRTLSSSEFQDLANLILRNAFRYGPLDPLLMDPTVSEIMVNNFEEVFVERNGKILKSKYAFASEHELMDVIRKMAASVGRRIDESNPMVDARLADGSRINAVIPPAAVDGPALTVRKFTKFLYDMGDLIGQETLDTKMAIFLHRAVLGGVNLLISGGTGSGKTTTLNVMGSLIPHDQRVVTIEDTAELQLQHPHVVRLEYRPPNVEGRGELTIRQLLRNSLRMRPDRIIVGEVRGAEALEMLQAMNTGHQGSMSTIHSNSARDALTRLETMVLSASIDLPLDAVRAQVDSAIDLIIHQVRRPDGKRKIVQIAELLGYTDGQPVIRDIFVFDAAAAAGGGYRPTGYRPRLLETIAIRGITCPDGVFDPASTITEKPGAPPA